MVVLPLDLGWPPANCFQGFHRNHWYPLHPITLPIRSSSCCCNWVLPGSASFGLTAYNDIVGCKNRIRGISFFCSSSRIMSIVTIRIGICSSQICTIWIQSTSYQIWHVAIGTDHSIHEKKPAAGLTNNRTLILFSFPEN